ncbi:MAG: hypothetical protein ACPG4X_21935 [Pikeienuella sp.]
MRGFPGGVSDATEAIYLLIHRLMDTKIIRRDAEIQNFLAAKAQAGGIASCVAQEILAHSYAELADFFSDLAQHGCVSGMI